VKDEVVSVGIVLKVTPFKENDAILSVYFKEYGKLSLLATGIRKPKSKNASACQSMMTSEFTFILKKGLCKLIKAQLIDGGRYIQNDLSSLACANLICEYFYRGIAENQPNLEHYSFLSESLRCLNQGYYYLQVYLFTLGFILKDSGSAIMVDHCAFCENSNQIVSIDVDAGGFICLQHLKSDQNTYTVDFLKMFRLINRGSIQYIDHLTTNLILLKQLKEIMEQFYEKYCPIRLNSKKFIYVMYPYRWLTKNYDEGILMCT